MNESLRKAVEKPFWAMTVDETIAALESRREGLSDGAAAERLRVFGANAIEERARMLGATLFFRQFTSPLILILVAAAAMTALLGEWVETVVIAAAVLANAFLGLYQEYRAENALAILKTYLRTRARVIRRGSEREIDAVGLVPGDVIRLHQGDRVPADARLVFVNNFEADESALTGESLPEEKRIEALPASVLLPDRTNMVWSGTLVTQGYGDAVVTATGRATEFGGIAHLVARRGREATPLQRAVARFSVWAGAVLGALIVSLFLIGLLRGYAFFDMFLIAVAIAVSAVPEGLPVALTVTMAIGVERLAARRAIVRRLLAAETLGSTSVILTDKTGTLTQARMEMARAAGFPADTDAARAALLRDALANTDVVIENPGDPFDSWRMAGRALEVALVRGAARMGVTALGARDRFEIRDRLPFSSEAKFSAVVYRAEKEERLALLGAPEMVVSHATLTEDEKRAVLADVARFAFQGERVLAVASRTLSPKHSLALVKRRFEGLVFRGLISFRDPLRPQIAGAIRRIGDAGVKTVIVTGDHPGTAEAVARELGFVDGAGAVLTGADIAGMPKEALAARAGDVAVYARVTPEQKLQLVHLYRARGEVVAVTGDGINDAPALAAADIGVAVGSGTDVAKSAADLVILDDDFHTIVAAIEEGRRVLDNIRKVIVYLLSDALDELLLIGGALLTGLALPLNALQILFVNFFSDSFPAIALAFEKGIDGLGTRPRKLHRNLFDRQMQFLILIIGVSTSFLLFLLYWLLLRLGFPPALVRTFIFASFATYSLFLAFSVRSLEKSIVRYNPFSNAYLTIGVGIGVALTLFVVYVPFFQRVFDTVPLPLGWLAAVFGMGILNIAAVELGKWIFRRRVVA